MAKAVVDDLETIQVNVECRETLAAPQLQLFQTASELLHEHRAVRQAGPRIEEPGAQHPFTRERSPGRVGQRAGNANGAFGAAHSDAAAEKQTIGAALVTDAVLVLEVIGLAREMRLQRLLERCDLVRMDPIGPVFEPSDG